MEKSKEKVVKKTKNKNKEDWVTKTMSSRQDNKKNMDTRWIVLFHSELEPDPYSVCYGKITVDLSDKVAPVW